MKPQEGKLLLRALNYDRIPLKKTVFETLMLHLNVPLIGLKPSKVGFLAKTEQQSEIDKILNNNARDKLWAIGLEAKRNTKGRTKSSRNILLDAEEVTKFGSYTHLFKVEFKIIEKSQRALQNGFLCGNTKISSNQIEKEGFTYILICFNCYKLEDHTSAKCPTKDTIVCSECTGNHYFKDCTSPTKKCLNCEGPHRTMSTACPKKKEIVKRKRIIAKEKEQEKQDQT